LTELKASFRDPDGAVYLSGDRAIRLVFPSAAKGIRSALEAASVRRLVTEGAFVESLFLEGLAAITAIDSLGLAATPPPGTLAIAHPRVPFPTYAHEWCPEMLYAAGKLTLQIAAALHADGLGLKDATPHNVLFRGARPILIDAASAEWRDPGDPTWLPQAQFTRTFVLPLLTARHCGMTLAQVFLADRDGLQPERVYDLLGMSRRLIPSFLFAVTLPTLLAGRANAQPAIYARRTEAPDKAAFMLKSTLNHLGRLLESAAPSAATSAWAGYMETKSYEGGDFEAKERFVQTVIDAKKPASVLDIGCNTGHFSELAAQHGAHIVALDSDPVCVAQTYQRALRKNLPIVALVGDIARPSPAIGWRNSEQASLLSRLTGRFDLVLMLAVLHHLLVTERIPLSDVLDLAADLTTDLLVLEYVGPTDTMFRRLVRGRDDLYSHMGIEWFEDGCRRRFEIIKQQPLGASDRRLYWLKKRG